MNKMNCKLYEQNDKRRKYIIYKNDPNLFNGYIVIEKYMHKNEMCWIIELMYITEQRKGYGTLLLDYVVNDMKNITNKLVVCLVSEEGNNFFKKYGFDENWSFYI